jgi:hypothetical protein
MRIGPSDIAPPHDFGFQLRHYVVAPEMREGSKLVDIVRTASGALVKVEVGSCGTVWQPCLELSIESHARLTASDVDDVRRGVVWRLGTGDDLRPFYALAEGDPALTASVEHNFGAKPKSTSSMFDAVINVICAQNTTFRRLYAMRTNLAGAFGDAFVTPERVYHASPRPEQLAAAPLDGNRVASATATGTSKPSPRPSPTASTSKASRDSLANKHARN